MCTVVYVCVLQYINESSQRAKLCLKPIRVMTALLHYHSKANKTHELYMRVILAILGKDSHAGKGCHSLVV